MNKFYILFILSTFAIMQTSRAKCIKDIAAIGLSFDSVSYKTERESNNEYAKLSSSKGFGIKASWIVFCPKSKLELQTYIRNRTYHFDDVLSFSEFSGIDENIKLFSIGIEGRKPFKVKNLNFEFPIDLELREELGFSYNYSTKTLIKNDFSNFKIQSGLRYFVWSKGKRSVMAVIKIGPLIPLGGDAKWGLLYGFSSEYFQKMGKKTSLKLDLYFDQYNQGFGEFDMIRSELGLRSNLVFRF